MAADPRRIPPLWREPWAFAEGAALPWHPVFWGAGVPRGEGRPVLLIPGFGAGDLSLATLSGWLRARGFRPFRAGLGRNIGCSGALIDALAARLDALGEPAVVIGQSRGGCLARALAVREPERVAAVIALGSPFLDELSSHPLVRASARLIAGAGDRGVPGLFTSACLDGECCEHYRRELRAPFPAGVPFVSVYSRRDGVIDWRACRDPDAEQVEVFSTHVGMGVEAGTYRAIAGALNRL